MPSLLSKGFCVSSSLLMLVVTSYGVAIWSNSAAKRQDDLDHRMFEAVRQKDAGEVRRLISQGANPNQPDTYPKISGIDRFVQRLLKPGAEPSDPGTLPLVAAISVSAIINGKEDNLDIVEALLKHGADPNAAVSNGETLLTSACRGQEAEVARLLIEHGADWKVTDSFGNKPLLLAARMPNPAAAAAMISRGADVNMTDATGDTPLTTAVRSYSEPVVELLLRYHCDVNRRTKSGETALSIARGNGSRHIAELLITAGAR